ncbi:MAG: DUF993 family protein [Planctomycetota bacterium JB042]
MSPPNGGRAREVRTAFAAAHVVMRPSYAEVDHAPDRPGRPDEIAPHIDWDATLDQRRHLIRHGLGVAEAMDTAQRNELDWEVAAELIRRTSELGEGFVAGASADHAGTIGSAAELAEAVAWQAGEIVRAGGVPIVMAQPWLVRAGLGPDAFVAFYADVVDRVDGELLIHWLGPMFLPALEGYFPGDSFDRVMDLDPEKVRGCKISLLDPELERRVRERIVPREQFVLTGDDHHFADLIVGDDPAIDGWTSLAGRPLALGRFSHALLGVLDGIAAPARAALDLLADGDVDEARDRLAALEHVGRVAFEPPTRFYKAGLAFLAWVNGRQEAFLLPNHLERTRDLDHLRRLFDAARAAGAIDDAAAAAERLRALEAGGQGESTTS